MPIAEYPVFSQGIRPNSYSAALFACNFRRAEAYKMVRHLNIHSTLRKDEWTALDRAVVEAGKEVLVGVNALRSAGLVRQESIAVSIAQYNKRSTTTDAQLAMNPLTDDERVRIDYRIAGVPIPFIFQGFQLDIRTLTASRQLGGGLDLETGAEAAYQVALAEEKLLFKGTPAIAVSDQLGALSTIYGYTTHPDRNTGSASGDWADTTNGYKFTMATLEAMKASLRADFYPGPYWLYLNSVNWGDIHLINTATDRQVMEVIRNDPEISRMEMSFQLATGEVLMIDPRPRTVQWVEAASIRTVEWDEKGSLGTNYRVLAAATPLIKSDYDGRCGVAHYTGA